MRSCFAIGVVALLAAGCAGPTPYQQVEDKYGFEDKRLEDNRFRVRFAGNSLTERTVVEEYLLYRAAELTLAEGGDYFRVADRDTEVDTRKRSTAYPSSHFLYGQRFWYRSFTAARFAYFSEERSIKRYSASMEILILQGEKPEDDPQAYDARALIENLAPSIVWPEDRKRA